MDRSPLNLVPVVRATITVVVAGFIFFAMLQLEAILSDPESTSRSFAVWATSATVGLVAWVFVFIGGLGQLRALEAPWKPGVRWLLFAIVLLVMLGLAATVFLTLLTSALGGRSFNPGVTLIVRILMVCGWVAAAPWLLLLWITDERVQSLRIGVKANGTGSFLPAIRELDAVWKAIERSSLALGLLLSTLVINTAFMRNVAIEAGVSPNSFSQWEVLGYGIFFMVILAAILIPVLVAWREAGFELVSRATPDTASGVPDEASAAARERLVVRIGIDRSYVRRPIAILGVLSPFLTSFITVLIPTGS
jgi:hypothetical protein